MIKNQELTQKKEALRSKTLVLASEFKNKIPEEFIFRLEDIMVDFVFELNSEAYNIKEEKVDRSEIIELFSKMDKRFEQTLHYMDKRFEQVDKRFEEMQIQMDKRFEQVDKRFEQVDKRFEEMQIQMNKRFEQVDKRFEEIQTQMNKRFEQMQIQMDKRFEEMQIQMNKRFEQMQIQMDKRFEQVDKRFNSMQWLISLGFTILGVLITVLSILSKVNINFSQ